MQRALVRPSRHALAALLALLSACSKDDSGTQTPAAPAPPPEPEVAKLVPADTAIYVQASSIERLVASIRGVTAAFDPAAAEAVSVERVLQDLEVPGAVEHLDPSKPLAICLVLSREPGAQPAPTFLLPVRSAEGLTRSVAESGMPMTTAVHGSYVAVSTLTEATPPAGAAGAAATPSTAPAIARGLPAGDVAVRLDVRRLVEHFRPMIDMGLGQMTAAFESMPAEATAGLDVGPFMKMYADGIRSVVDSGETLDLAAKVDGSLVDVTAAFTVREGSALDGYASSQATDARALGKFLDPRSAIGMVIGMDQAAMLRRTKPLVEATFSMYPEPMRSAFQGMMGRADELAALMGSAMCVNGGFGADGLRYAVYLRPTDPEKLLEAYRSMMTGVPGLELGEFADAEVAGMRVRRSRLRVDAAKLVGENAPSDEASRALFERMYGPDGLAFTVATQDGTTAVVVGGDDLFLEASLGRMRAPVALPAPFARALDQFGALNPCFVVRYDLKETMAGVRGLLAGTPLGEAGAFPEIDASFTVSGGVDGRVWRGALSTDVSELGAWVRKMRSPGAPPGEEAPPQPSPR